MAADKTHVIELASPAYIRPRYLRRENTGGGFVVTVQAAKARRYDPAAAARAKASLHEAFTAGGFTATAVPFAALAGGAS